MVRRLLWAVLGQGSLPMPWAQGCSARRRMASSCLMIDDFAKDYLNGQLRSVPQALIWKLGGDAVRNPDLVEVRP